MEIVLIKPKRMITATQNISRVTSSLKSVLRDIIYPTTKERIIEVAEQNGADDFILTVLDDVGESSYFGLTDLVDEITYVESDEYQQTMYRPSYR